MNRLTPARLLVAAAAAACIAFSIVQDRMVAAGVGRYLTLQRAALAGRGPAVAIADVMEPAVRESVRQGLFWAGGVLVIGFGLAAARWRSPAGR